jgi:2-polyprenyl-6-methoxyphenol hydroxylase-like FAD-dependent oxidoreductase
VFFAGDAARIHLPFGGQRVNLGLAQWFGQSTQLPEG